MVKTATPKLRGLDTSCWVLHVGPPRGMSYEQQRSWQENWYRDHRVWALWTASFPYGPGQHTRADTHVLEVLLAMKESASSDKVVDLLNASTAKSRGASPNSNQGM